MRTNERNMKEAQQILQQAYRDAESTVNEVHQMLTRRRQDHNVGRTISLAAGMGLLETEGRSGPIRRKLAVQAVG